ncbi:MAG: hypothetical protein N2035_08960 [Chthoniobacterales bacterium]|nr:hypothetical protein [Chthoniobacterales bacterium]
MGGCLGGMSFFSPFEFEVTRWAQAHAVNRNLAHGSDDYDYEDGR